MSQPELLRRVVNALAEARIEYMITGSIVSSLQGEPRLTHDIDIVVAIEGASVPLLLRSFPSPDYYLACEAVVDAILHGTTFNLIDVSEGSKVDFWILTDDPFDRSRFARRCLESVFGMELQLSSPEDTILAKLRWARMSGGSEKQCTDALRVYEVQYPGLDLDYLQQWAISLEVEDLWSEIRMRAVIPA